MIKNIRKFTKYLIKIFLYLVCVANIILRNKFIYNII